MLLTSFIQEQMTKEYYFISDLHIGGDGPLDQCDFEEELIAFLKQLELMESDLELIIVGDAFGLWEFTKEKGVDKMRKLVSSHTKLFDQFTKTGAKIPITLIPGNHDYDLACFPEYVPYLEQFNIRLEPVASITRPIGEYKIWIEHGNQHDDFNAFEEFGDPADTPVGFFVTSQFVGGASEISALGKQNWLKDIQAVYPTEHVPHWVFSNYFYREMSPILRWFLVPFILLFTFSAGIVLLAIAEEYGLLETSLSQLKFLNYFGGIGSAIAMVVAINSAIISFLLMLSIPLFFLIKDIKSTLKRYRLIGKEGLVLEKKENYDSAARKVFAEDPEVKVFIYGHTHNASLDIENGRAIINTGTWLKKLTRIPALFRFMPSVYYPTHALNIFKVFHDGEKIAIEYLTRDKNEEQNDLTLMQKIMTWRKKPAPPSIPSLTRI